MRWLHIITYSLVFFSFSTAQSVFFNRTEIALGFYSGEIQGIKSNILRPNYFLSFLSKHDKGNHRYHIFSRFLYGDARTATGDVNDKPLQIDIFLKLYRYFFKEENFRILFGGASEIYIPVGDLEPLIYKVKVQYGAGEDKIPTDKKFNIGVNIRLDGVYKKFFSSLEIQYYIYGNRVAPNLSPIAPLFGVFWKNRVFIKGDFYKPTWTFFINGVFIMQKKYDGSKIFTKHDFFAGTKREFDIEMGTDVFIGRFHIFFVFYGYNNLNRGWSRTEPKAFRDGFYVGAGFLI